MINIQALIDNAKCYQTVRELRWPNGTTCPACNAKRVISKGRDDTQPDRRHASRALHDATNVARVTNDSMT